MKFPEKTLVAMLDGSFRNFPPPLADRVPPGTRFVYLEDGVFSGAAVRELGARHPGLIIFLTPRAQMDGYVAVFSTHAAVDLIRRSSPGSGE